MDVYERLAGFYDLVYCDTTDLEFYIREAQNAEGPVLEVACGTGRILLSMIDEGIEATGMDISEPMIKVLKQKAEALGIEPDVHVADMRDFDLGKKFSLIILPYRSILHMANDADRRKAFECFMRHLKEGGRLILHTYNPSEEEKAMTGEYHSLDSERFLTPEGDPYELEWQLRYDPKDDSGYYKVAIIMDGGFKEEFSMHIHYVQTKHLRRLLADAGFKSIRIYGGFDYSDYDPYCNEVVWIADK